MTDKILTTAGIPYRVGRFTKAKPATYAVVLDDVTTDGPDGLPMILQHDVTVELYEDRPDPTAEYNLETALTGAGMLWTKQARYWLQSEQQYQVIYEFTYYEKRRL